jgi:uncharacterized protein
VLRTSSYTIYVDLPHEPDEMLLVHGYAGTYDRVSRRVASFVRSLEVRRPPKPLYGEWTPEPEIDGVPVAPAEETLRLLRRRGYLTELAPAEEEDLFERIVGKLHARDVQQVPSYIFMPTYDCNLRCAYCFQDAMRTDAKLGQLLRIMEPGIVDRIFRALPRIEALHGIAEGAQVARSIGFFGGEPLLAQNRPIVEYILGKTRELGKASFWAVTNATELEAYADLLGPQDLSSVQVTLDGPPGEHDRRRIYADGSGSFLRIARNISLALERGVEVSVRLNLDRNNIGQVPALADEILAWGWSQAPRFSVYCAPITAENEQTDSRSTFNTWELEQALEALREEHPQVAVVGLPDDRIKHDVRRLFATTSQLPLTLKSSFCGAHNRMYIFDAFADIYACWERTGDARVRIGTIAADGGVTLNQGLSQQWRSRTVASNPVCRRCRYALHCGGGCAVLAVGKTGEFHSNFCDGFQSRFRASVAKAYVEHARGEALQATKDRVCDL